MTIYKTCVHKFLKFVTLSTNYSLSAINSWSCKNHFFLWKTSKKLAIFQNGSEFPQLDAGVDGGFIQHTYRTGLAWWNAEWHRYLVQCCLSGTPNPSVLNNNLWRHFASFFGGKPHNHQHIDSTLTLCQSIILLDQMTRFILPKRDVSLWTMYAPHPWAGWLPRTNHTPDVSQFCRSKQYQTGCYMSQNVLLEAKADCTSSLCSAVPNVPS